MVIYEWKDVTYLGVDTPDDTVGVNYPVGGKYLQTGRNAHSVLQKTYICTTSAGKLGRDGWNSQLTATQFGVGFAPAPS